MLAFLCFLTVILPLIVGVDPEAAACVFLLSSVVPSPYFNRWNKIKELSPLAFGQRSNSTMNEKSDILDFLPLWGHGLGRNPAPGFFIYGLG